MSDQGLHIIQSLKSKWRREMVLSHLLVAAGIAGVAGYALFLLLGISLWWTAGLFILISAVILLTNSGWKIEERGVTKLLDEQMPSLQDSSGLFLKPVDSLGVLERLQVQRIASAFEASTAPQPFQKLLKRSLLVFAICLLIVIAVFALGITPLNIKSSTTPPEKIEKGILPASVSSVTVSIVSPSYTGLSKREQNNMNIRAAADSKIGWQIVTNQPAKDIRLLLNDSNSVLFNAETNNRWTASITLQRSGFYKLIIDGRSSEYYKLEGIADLAPVIKVLTPGSHTSIDFGQQPILKINAKIEDDYALTKAQLVMTIANGKGESVKFKEKTIALTELSAGQKHFDLQRVLNLNSLEMIAGDELYFYINATDNKQQQISSDMYTVKIEDTAELMSVEGLISGVDLKPEFFRSQRQIIIETEQLIRDQSRIGEQAFKDKSNQLGNDQKLLRLRYGKFLGEEGETHIGEEGEHHDDEHALSAEDFNNAEKIADPYTHKHDIAEDATFFDPATKKQLRATLNEMWDAELRLRTYKPTEALPFEYKALRLLKELQQQSRSYVAKTNTRMPPLKPEKRLTGELGEITQPRIRRTIKSTDETVATMRKALAQLESGETIDPNVLASTGQILSDYARNEPSVYLSSLEALKRLQTGKTNINDTRLLQSSFSRILKENLPLPVKSSSSPEQILSRDYFMNLQKQAKQQ